VFAVGGKHTVKACQVDAALAAEGEQVFGVTAIATHPQESVFQTAAFEVIFEFPLDVARQYRTLCRQMEHECRVVFFDDLVKKAALR
jgi:hypothetical protein